MNSFLGEQDAQVIGVCDPYETHFRDQTAGRAFGWKPAAELVGPHQFGGRFPAKCTAGGLVAEMGLIRIAHANHLRILFAEERIHYARTTAAGANEPDREAVAGGGLGAPSPPPATASRSGSLAPAAVVRA